ncbi:MAG: ParB/RepB/Spo0J family partition protein [Lactobacillales bacterium]|jgi:ParB family chromosome partitioning protein|nr:ParB/RepB/Spo0J family partition protein [Lactobacillales bacterium]
MDQIQSIDIGLVEPDPNQPRKYFDHGALEQLKQSIDSTTLIDPLIVRENGQKPSSFFIVDGERRWRACKELGHAQIKCRIIPTGSLDHEIVAFSQNVHRADLTIMEKAVHLDKLLSKIKAENPDAQQNDLVPKVGLSKGYISELIKIIKLADDIKNEALLSSSWTRSKLLRLAGIVKPDVRMRKFEEFKSLVGRRNEKLSEQEKKSKEADSEDTIPDIKLTIAKEESHLRRIKRFKTHADTFIKKLEKLKKSKLEVSYLKTIESDLDRVVRLIHGILS